MRDLAEVSGWRATCFTLFPLVTPAAKQQSYGKAEPKLTVAVSTKDFPPDLTSHTRAPEVV